MPVVIQMIPQNLECNILDVQITNIAYKQLML